MQAENSITIALDCMGGDFAPNSVLDSLKIVKEEFGSRVNFLLFGDKNLIENYLAKNKIPYDNCKIVHTDVVVTSDEKPSVALRRGRHSSMGMAIQAVKNGEAKASISAGNTGALMALSKLILRTLPDIDRPALVQLMPNRKHNCTAMLDMGANIDCDSLNLYQFALMGNAYYSSITGKEQPTIGLLNIGSEDIKGNDVIRETSLMLQESKMSRHFIGFIEGDDILTGKVDVVVSDGFAGNVALKSIEGVSKFFTDELKYIFKSSLISKFAFLLLTGKFKKFKNKIDPSVYNGAMFVGLNGISIKSHGSADGKAFACAIRNTINLINSDINSKIMNLVKETE